MDKITNNTFNNMHKHISKDKENLGKVSFIKSESKNNIVDLKDNNKNGILRMLSKLRYINKKQGIKVNVADTSVSRYLTDEEVQEIFTELSSPRTAPITDPFANLR